MRPLIRGFITEYVISGERTVDIFERKLTHCVDSDDILDRHQHTGANWYLTGFSFVAKPRCDIGHRADGGIIETSLKADIAKRGKPVRYADAKSKVVPQLLTDLGPRPASFRANLATAG
jgi:hypothetical protein